MVQYKSLVKVENCMTLVVGLWSAKCQWQCLLSFKTGRTFLLSETVPLRTLVP